MGQIFKTDLYFWDWVKMNFSLSKGIPQNGPIEIFPNQTFCLGVTGYPNNS